MHEDTLSFGFGAEIAARIADELFERLDAPVRRVAAADTWVGYHPDLENAVLPQTDDIVREAEALLAWWARLVFVAGAFNAAAHDQSDSAQAIE